MLASVDVHFGVPGNTPYQWAVFGLLVVTKDLPAWQWTRPPSAGTTIWLVREMLIDVEVRTRRS